MNIFNLFGGKPDRNKIIKKIVKFIFKKVKYKGRIRVEDALCFASTIIAERCIIAAGDYDLYDHDYIPGSRIFSDRINELLYGDGITEDWEDLSVESVFGYLREKVKNVLLSNAFPELDAIFTVFAEGVGNKITEENWGKVPYTVRKENIPYLLPIQVGFGSRPYIDEIFRNTDFDKHQKVMILVDVLVEILRQTRLDIASATALKISCETINGMSKTAPMTIKAMEKAEKYK